MSNQLPEFEFERDQDTNGFVIKSRTLDDKVALSTFDYHPNALAYRGIARVEYDGYVNFSIRWTHKINAELTDEQNVADAVDRAKRNITQLIADYERMVVNPQVAMDDFFGRSS